MINSKPTIYIPTKNRFGNIKTIEHLGSQCREHYNLVLVVEPNELLEYDKHHHEDVDEILVIPENDRGLEYVRQWLYRYALHQDRDWYWMLDDDITGFYESDVTETKCTRQPEGWRCLRYAEKFATDNCGQMSLEYQQYAWSQTENTKLNSYQDVCVRIHPVRCYNKGISFSMGSSLKVDRDFTIQVIKSGLDAIRVCTVAFSAPKNGSNEGGLKPLYDETDVEATSSRWMEKKWGPDIAQFKIKPDGRPDTKVHWKNIRKNQTTLF